MFHYVDIFKKSFLEGWISTDVGAEAMLMTMLVAAFLAAYVLLVYRLSAGSAPCQKDFCLSLVGVTLITAAIILTIQSNLVISLGMVGALSIVRFRTAVKSPRDLMFLFWAISVGIICGAGLAVIALILCLTLTAVIAVLNRYPAVMRPLMLVVNADVGAEGSEPAEKVLTETVEKFSKKPLVRSRSLSGGVLTVTFELSTREPSALSAAVAGLPGVTFVNLFDTEGNN